MKTFALLCCLFLLLVTSPAVPHAATGYVITEEIASPMGTEKKVTYVTDSGLRGEEKGKVTILAIKGSDVKLFEIDQGSKTARDDSAMAPMLVLGYMMFLECDEDGKHCKEKKDFITPPKKEEYSTIAGKRARKMLVKMPLGTTTQWYTKDWAELIEADRLRNKLFLSAFQMNAGGSARSSMQDSIVGVTERISREYGGMVMSEFSLMGFNSITKILSVEKKDLSGDLFRPPANYKIVKQELGGMEEEDDDEKPAKRRRR